MIKPYYTDLSTGDNVVHDGPCVIYGIELARSGAADLLVYNDPDSADTPVFELRVTGETPTDRMTNTEGYFLSNGCFAVLSAGNGKVIWYPA